MTKIKLVNGTIISAQTVELVEGVLKITTTEHTVEELAEMFSDKENTNLITLMTESEIESGFQTGFTSFAGILYGADGLKTVQLFQPADVTESRISNAEGVANAANSMAESAKTTADASNQMVGDLSTKNSDLESELTDTQLAVAELAELIAGGAE